MKLLFPECWARQYRLTLLLKTTRKPEHFNNICLEALDNNKTEKLQDKDLWEDMLRKKLGRVRK